MISIFRHLFSQEVPKEPEVKTKFDYVRDRMYRNAFNCRRQIILDV